MSGWVSSPPISSSCSRLLVVIERRKLLPAAVYSVGVVVVTYVLFVYLLKTPLQTGPFGF